MSQNEILTEHLTKNESKSGRWRKLIPEEPVELAVGKANCYHWTLQTLMHLNYASFTCNQVINKKA